KTVVPKLPKRLEPFSTIINDEHAAEISSWIDRKETPYSSSSIPYDFELVEGSEEILGGYNPLTWNTEHQEAYHTNDKLNLDHILDLVGNYVYLLA
ncbi:13345_t:CDS:2, partial [Acaulospora colombiana]